MDNFKQQFQIYWNIRWLRRSVISAITLIVMLVAIPFIIQYSISHLLIKQGANKVEIEDINLNLFAGTFELKQLAITTGNNKPSQLEHLYANINMLDLVLSKIVLHEVKILGLKADIHRSDDGTISINGLSYPANDSTAAKTDAEVSESKPLAFAIDSLSINNSHINYQETDFIQNNQIISLALTNLDSTDTTVDANLKLDSVLNDAPFKLTADLNLFNAVQHFKGNASLGSMAFTHYAKFYSSYVDKLQGNISIESDFDINLSARITAKISNHIQISDVDANYQGIQPGLKKLRLKGTTEISNIDFTNLQKHQSDAQANIKDSQLNLFTGTLELDQLAVSSADNIPSKIKHMEIAVEKLDALSNRFLINDILIDGVETNIERADNGQISINGLVIPTSVETDTTTPQPAEKHNSNPVTFALNKISLVNSDINYKESDFEQINHISSAVVSNLKSWDKTSLANFKLDSRLNDATFKVNADLNLFNDVKQFKGNASLESLAFTPYAKFYRDYLENVQGSISLKSDFSVNLAETISAKLNNSIQVSNLHLDYQDISQSVQEISWKGNSTFTDNAEISVKGNLQIDKSQTTDKKQNYLISSFDQLIIEELQKNLTSISFNQLNIEKIQLVNSHKDNRFVQLNEIKVQDAEFDTKTSQLKIKQVGLENPEIQIEITEQKQLAQLIPLLKTIENLKPVTEEKVEPQQNSANSANTVPIKIEIGKLQLSNPGFIDFSDLSVSPNYKTRINLNRLDISNISSTDNAQFDIALKQGKYTTVDIKGEGLLFDPTKNMQLTAKIKQLDLPPVTPYSSNAMGYGLKSGVIDTDIKMKLENKEIDAEIDLKIDSIEVVETDKGTAEQVSSASGMSLDLAISSLKDSDNIIDLKLPIKGNTDKPDFDLSQVINKAMGKAMKSATLSYLKHTLQPFGSLITLYSLAKKAADHISLPPLLFEPNSLVFKKDQQELLDKVIKVLTERPALKIKACGISALEDQLAIKKILLDEEVSRLEAINKTAKDKAKADKKIAPEVVVVKVEDIKLNEQMIQQKMRDLADNRAAKVKAFFLEQGKLPSSRILNCLSTNNLEEKSVASVELLI